MSDRVNRLRDLADYLRRQQFTPMAMDTSAGFTIALVAGHEKSWDRAIMKSITLQGAIGEAEEELRTLIGILESIGSNE